MLAGEAGDKLCCGLQTIIDDLDLPFFVYNHGSIIHLETHGVLLLDTTDPDFFTKVMQRKEIAEEMGAAYTAEGVITLAGSRLYSSMADTDEVIEEALGGFARTLVQAPIVVQAGRHTLADLVAEVVEEGTKGLTIRVHPKAVRSY